MSETERRWIVDGYNVLRVSLSPRDPVTREPGRWWGQERRSALTAIASRLPYPDDPVVLVFDARQLAAAQVQDAPDAVRPGVRHVYAPSADEWIVSAVAATKQSRAGATTVVVTADRSLADRVRHRGAEVMATDEFVTLCGESPI